IVDLHMTLSSTQPTIYSVVPQLMLQNDSGQQTVDLSALSGTVALADPGQVSCYKAQGTTLVPEQITGYDPGSGTWCV
ncbi:MAG: hypothetical protein ACRDGS_08840, partial [Chloroflexota bacterium]